MKADDMPLVRRAVALALATFRPGAEFTDLDRELACAELRRAWYALNGEEAGSSPFAGEPVLMRVVPFVRNARDLPGGDAA